ncbi:NAD(P)H-hydrate dehydratase [Acidovorax sp. GBBC 3334]|uniref:NAD(P)H-hydrate dehydratase n=1 Tax=Acidovorax sp. GBBC 3334 TaxID=2940496 RepID=UPI002303CFA2|nr:NAD(P)H-hydrate dehydratase [Acidovorax sp. GBBC 3334]MDA8456375.1 NAD(P)H-hydrate dehydratase [Acidovorax sp. GBBC 3334]
MHRITSDTPHALFGVAATRRIERTAMDALAPYTLMERAGQAVARLALAVAPHARRVWIACGAGNNGGDGLEAALRLHRHGLAVQVSWLGSADTAPADARHAWERVRSAGVPCIDSAPDGLGADDLCIDALLGIGLAARPDGARPPDPRLQALLHAVRGSAALVLCVDGPSGLQADTGQYLPGLEPEQAPSAALRHTLGLLTAKPGWFTGVGRDAAGHVWLDGLGVDAAEAAATAWLSGPGMPARRAHASHKGSYGDVAVVGGEPLGARGMGMTGAALLAASAALHGGAGRVLVTLLDGDGADALAVDPLQPEAMLRRFDALEMDNATVVCGCGGGQAIRRVLPRVLSEAPRLVLDADGLNAVASDAALASQLQAREARHGANPTVLTPHPLEAARLLGKDTAAVQADRLGAAQALADRFRCVVVLKGSGSAIAAPGQVVHINPTGNARLATGGTGDVLAGFLGAAWAARPGGAGAAFEAARAACHAHGLAADRWPAGRPLTASELARHLSPC